MADRVQAAHILVKHRDSRRPSSWKENNITRTKDEATAKILAYAFDQFFPALSLAVLSDLPPDRPGASPPLRPRPFIYISALARFSRLPHSVAFSFKKQLETAAKGDPAVLKAEFMKLARPESDCSSHSQGGDLGFFGHGEMQW